mmetsp:Transcript_19776/g.29479  ORF Transcript_19776/g.29479 Transcript_19776/m.29479 type:complete len:93 (+) Transcript_19776:508-786(+)
MVGEDVFTKSLTVLSSVTEGASLSLRQLQRFGASFSHLAHLFQKTIQTTPSSNLCIYELGRGCNFTSSLKIEKHTTKNLSLFLLSYTHYGMK